jgi:8-oxo-dGTP pyrophosphatase MutT (NUDIX family)
MADYNKVGLLVVQEGRILLCRKRRGAALFILPGGCIEDAETPEQCLRREIHEELGPGVEARDVRYLGTYSDVAAGDEAKMVEVQLYSGELTGRPEPHSEIAELVWFGPADDRSLLAPSIARKILPDLLARKLLDWPETPPLT